MKGNKYKVPQEEAEGKILPNKRGLTKVKEIEQEEFEGFLYAYKILFAELTGETAFDLRYVMRIHKLALDHLYEFAGKTRTVNISKGGFMFPPAKFLGNTMKESKRKF